MKDLSKTEKEVLDTYLLKYALKYYEDYGSEEDLVSNDITQNFNKSFEQATEPVLVDTREFEEALVNDNEISVQQKNGPGMSTLASSVAAVRIFADPTTSKPTQSSGHSLNLGNHAFITVSNISSSTIVVGKFNVAPGKTLSLGTWGNKAEHTGLWYNLESYMIKTQNFYSNRVSAKVNITQSNLNVLNSHIIGFDRWSELTNCSSFAASSWNSVAFPAVSAGVINTPKNLASSIKNINSSVSGGAVPFDYIVYYANGSGTPSPSTIFR